MEHLSCPGQRRGHDQESHCAGCKKQLRIRPGRRLWETSLRPNQAWAPKPEQPERQRGLKQQPDALSGGEGSGEALLVIDGGGQSGPATSSGKTYRRAQSLHVATGGRQMAASMRGVAVEITDTVVSPGGGGRIVIQEIKQVALGVVVVSM